MIISSVNKAVRYGFAAFAALMLLCGMSVTASMAAKNLYFKSATKNMLLFKRDLSNLKLPSQTPSHSKAKPQGPDPSSAFDLVDMVEDETIIAALEQVAGWNPHLIFQDIAVPTLFYYIPRELRLVYDASGYGFRVQYNSLESGENGSVLVSMSLKAPYHSGDVKLLERILRQCWDPSSEVKALPAFGAEADLENLTAGFGFSGGQIHLSAPSTLRQACSLVIGMTPDQAEALIAQMSGPGVTGTLNVPVGENPVSIPIILAFDRFSGEILDGIRQWQSGQKVERIVNIAMFPVRLTAVNAFVKQGSRLKFKSKPLKKSVKIPPRGSKPFRLPSAKKIFGSNTMMAWIDTEIIAQCDRCRKKIEKAVKGGIGTAPMEIIKFEAIPDIFELYDIYKLIVEVRSRFFTANGDYEETREFEITGDETSTTARLYIPSGSKRSPFSYRLRVISADGRLHQQEMWQQGSSTLIYIGQVQLEALLGTPDKVDQDEEHNLDGQGYDVQRNGSDEGYYEEEQYEDQ